MKKLKRIILRIYTALIGAVVYPVLLHEKQKPPFEEYNERSVEFAFIFKHLSKLAPERILDVGSGRSALPAMMANCGFIVDATDQKKGYWKGRGSVNRHYLVKDMDIVKCDPRPIYDVVTCVSTLEHIKDWRIAVKNMIGWLKPGGVLLLTCPCSPHEYIADVYEGKKHFFTQSFALSNIFNAVLTCRGNPIFSDTSTYKIFSGRVWNDGHRVVPAEENCKDFQLACFYVMK